MPRHGWREPRTARRVSCRTRALDAKTNARRGDGELRRLVYACGFGRGSSRRDAERARAHDGCAHGSPRLAPRQVDYTEVRNDAGDVFAAVVDGDGAENVSHAMEHGFRYDENAGSRADASSVLDRARVSSDVDSALVELAFLLYNPPEPEIFEHRALLNLMETSGEVAAIDARGQ